MAMYFSFHSPAQQIAQYRGIFSYIVKLRVVASDSRRGQEQHPRQLLGFETRDVYEGELGIKMFKVEIDKGLNEAHGHKGRWTVLGLRHVEALQVLICAEGDVADVAKRLGLGGQHVRVSRLWEPAAWDFDAQTRAVQGLSRCVRTRGAVWHNCRGPRGSLTLKMGVLEVVVVRVDAALLAVVCHVLCSAKGILQLLGHREEGKVGSQGIPLGGKVVYYWVPMLGHGRVPMIGRKESRITVQ